MRRYRLRFAFQEFDLAGTECLIGRSAGCHITLQDPLVSRRHARLAFGHEGATIEDLGSRNGVLLNGRRLGGVTRLKDGDRIRIGTHEMVLGVGARSRRETASTGMLRVCHACQTPFPTRAARCPHCGSIRTEERQVESTPDQRSWTFELMAQVAGRAIDDERAADAERILRKGAMELERHLGQSFPGSAGFDEFAHCALRLGQLLRDAYWINWVVAAYDKAGLPPGPRTVELLGELEAQQVPQLRESIMRLRKSVVPPSVVASTVAE